MEGRASMIPVRLSPRSSRRSSVCVEMVCACIVGGRKQGMGGIDGTRGRGNYEMGEEDSMRGEGVAGSE